MRSRFELAADLMSLGPDGAVDEFVADLAEAAVTLTRAAQLVPVTSEAGRAVAAAHLHVKAAADAYRHILPTAPARGIEQGGGGS